MKYKVGSLFAGVGGICLGFKNAGFELAWANEIDSNACKTYRHNFQHSMLEGDVNLILEPDKAGVDKEKYLEIQKQILSTKIDVLTGGFPCQAFSIAGEQKGFEDERGNLFLSIIKLVKMLKNSVGEPSVLLLENVKNLMAHDSRRTYKVIKAEIEKIGYSVIEFVLNTMEYTDIPQNRERIYIVCFKDKEDLQKFITKDELLKKKKVYSKEEREQHCIDLFEDSAEDKYYYTAEKYPRYYIEADNNTEKARINLTEQINERYQFYQLRRGMYVRKNKSNVCPTLTANMGTGGHNVPLILNGKGIRKLTPREVFKLQGFPIDKGYELPQNLSDANLYKQAGNAVSVPVVQILAEEILTVLKQKD